MQTLLCELVEIESPSDQPAAVARLASHLADFLRRAELGLAVDLLDVPGGGPLLRARRGAAGQRVMLLGHLDTVWPLGTLRDRPLRLADGKLSGPGSYDMKAGLVIALYALLALHAHGEEPAVTLYFTPLEEVGALPYLAQMEEEMRACRAVLDFEPAWPGGAVKTARKGAGTFLVRARGRAAHAGADLAQGRNAIVELARQTLVIEALNDPARGTSLNVGVVRGGVRSNVVPERAEAEVDFRVRTLADAWRVETALRALRPQGEGLALEVEGGLHCPPLERGPRVAALYDMARALAAELGFELPEVSTGGASEASYAGALGLPVLDGLGADGDGAHAEHEFVWLASLAPRAALAAGLLRQLTNGD